MKKQIERKRKKYRITIKQLKNNKQNGNKYILILLINTITTLKVNRINAQIKTHKVAEWIICCLSETYFKPKTHAD